MRGRKPTPTVLAQLHGNPSHGRRKNPGEPRPAGALGDVNAPEWLTPEQRTRWERLVADAPRGLLTSIDAPLVTCLVVAIDLHRQACQALAAQGRLTEETPDGMAVVSPLIAIMNRQAALIVRLCGELGFSPTSRVRIAIPAREAEGSAATPLEEFLARRPPPPKFN